MPKPETMTLQQALDQIIDACKARREAYATGEAVRECNQTIAELTILKQRLQVPATPPSAPLAEGLNRKARRAAEKASKK